MLIESRLIYERSLLTFQPVERYPCRLAEIGDIPYLAETAAKTINYFDRFHADPFIKAEQADQLMRRWVDSSISGNFADITVVPDAKQPTAFVATRLHRGRWDDWGLRLAQVVLSAVSVDFKGWHRKLISEACVRLRESGAEHIYMPTQVTNIGAIRTCERQGWSLSNSQHVFRLVLSSD